MSADDFAADHFQRKCLLLQRKFLPRVIPLSSFKQNVSNMADMQTETLV